jgi:hypothetical protein
MGINRFEDEGNADPPILNMDIITRNDNAITDMGGEKNRNVEKQHCKRTEHEQS